MMRLFVVAMATCNSVDVTSVSNLCSMYGDIDGNMSPPEAVVLINHIYFTNYDQSLLVMNHQHTHTISSFDIEWVCIIYDARHHAHPLYILSITALGDKTHNV